MPFTFPNSEIEAQTRNPNGILSSVRLKLRWGVLLVYTSYAEYESHPLQNSNIVDDPNNSSGFVIRFRSNSRSRIYLLFRNSQEKLHWRTVINRCRTWTIDDYYTLGEELGRGAYGVVMGAIDRNNDSRIAIKMIPSNSMRGNNELDIMTKIQHVNVLDVLDVLQSHSNTYVILPLMGGDIYTEVIEKGNRDMGLIRTITLQILLGLDELHQNGIIHRDLKPENILCKFTPQGAIQCKIADFGLAHELWHPHALVRNGRFYGSRMFASPEMHDSRPYGTKSDIFSVGCILFELITGEPAFGGADDSVLNYVEAWGNVEDEVVGDLVQQLLLRNQLNRPSAREALEHEWFEANN